MANVLMNLYKFADGAWVKTGAQARTAEEWQSGAAKDYAVRYGVSVKFMTSEKFEAEQARRAEIASRPSKPAGKPNVITGDENYSKIVATVKSGNLSSTFLSDLKAKVIKAREENGDKARLPRPVWKLVEDVGLLTVEDIAYIGVWVPRYIAASNKEEQPAS